MTLNCIRAVTAAILFMPLDACVGISSDEIRSAPKETVISERHLDEVLVCFQKQEALEMRNTVTTFPQANRVEIAVTALQAGRIRHYYLITLMPFKGRTQIALQDARLTNAVSRSEMLNIIQRCAGT
ncbi:hypothetical protein [Parvibaculum sp.]|jgi:hypothetical protein|uniref:hypothetical protein n=1 Tax=Parvibaculum sp. TaxID=2024848 RepID=UPI000C50A62A|nr:hypothetical protein [Parvibaculum sp.]MAM94356.1 hypothetical protein [Parvibaculum sp.]|tara:strand:+ start:32577 stop:32957 length:381 start_codon:yes stop_codon:yes gene_type:complete